MTLLAFLILSLLALAFNLVSIAGFYFMLEAQFIALLQVIVYAGAIMVLILFVIMLLNLREEVTRPHPAGRVQRWLGPLLAVGFVAVLGRMVFRADLAPFPKLQAGYGTAGAVGREVFTRFVWPFEVISLLLVVADGRRGASREAEALAVDPRYFLFVSAVLFTLGVAGVLLRRGAITMVMNYSLLNLLSSESGGEFFFPDDYSGLLNILKHLKLNSSKEKVVTSEINLWSDTWMLIIAVLLFSLEWFIRKRNGML